MALFQEPPLELIELKTIRRLTEGFSSIPARTGGGGPGVKGSTSEDAIATRSMVVVGAVVIFEPLAWDVSRGRA